jgi:uncharacterized protein (TIGR02996 family)
VTEAEFLAALADAPDDLDLWGVYADWLEESEDSRSGDIRALVRIKQLLGEAGVTPYTPGPRLTEPELAAWEAVNAVSLPGPFRLFLCHVGNGGEMSGGYCDFKLVSLDLTRHYPQLKEPFPISWQRFRERLDRVRLEGRASVDSLFPELEPFWEGPWQMSPGPGCLALGRYPSYDGLFLVVTGELRGTVWCAVDGGVPEVRRSGEPHTFLTWFEDTLLELRSE